MRIMLFFDLPSVTSAERKSYRKFVKNLKEDGFFSLQESVFVKLAINQQAVDLTLLNIKSYLPSDGNVMTLCITEKQFASMEIMLGESTSDVINTCDRIVIL